MKITEQELAGAMSIAPDTEYRRVQVANKLAVIIAGPNFSFDEIINTQSVALMLGLPYDASPSTVRDALTSKRKTQSGDYLASGDSLTALTTERWDMQSDGEGIDHEALAAAMELPASSTKEDVLRYLTKRARELWPLDFADDDGRRRLDLVKLSAGAMKGLRRGLLKALSASQTNGLKGLERAMAASNMEVLVEGFSDFEIVALSVGAQANRRGVRALVKFSTLSATPPKRRTDLTGLARTAAAFEE